jgi:hypothetical protein
MYKLKDIMNEPIKGVFYEPELQKVEKDENALWFIEKKLRKRKCSSSDLSNIILIREILTISPTLKRYFRAALFFIFSFIILGFKYMNAHISASLSLFTSFGAILFKLLRFLKNEGIYYFTTQNSDTKANVVERVIKTIKNMMYRYFTKQRTHRFVNDMSVPPCFSFSVLFF